ncbi:MAG TPA: dTDP-4-dehydrorhamnose 3,5-epimerase [Thermoanaerobaculia bacterium]|nr:dTDP-4-dehydrorhamnose 3,5-epimerase [Thermoanaerobaculia bacterium]
MKFVPLEIPDVVLIEPRIFEDGRGFFFEVYRQDKFEDAGLPGTFVQDNQSFSKHGVVRGLHAQLTQPQGKLIRTLQGEIFDVAVDVRPDSPTFGKWVSAVLSGENNHQLWVPPGFVHGFCVTSEFATVQYKCTDLYAPSDEIGVRWDDPEIGISWPVANPVLNAKDRAWPTLAEILPQILQQSPGHGKKDS